MRKSLLASLFLSAFVPACHGIVAVDESPPGATSGGDAGGATGAGTGTKGDAGSDSFTGTGDGGGGSGGGATTTSTTDTGSTSTTDTGSTSTTDTGTFTNPACAAPINGLPGGAIAAAQTFEPQIWQVVIDPAGNPIVTGIFTGQVTLGGTVLTQVGAPSFDTPDSFVAKLDPCGQVVWVKQFGTPGADYVAGISTSPSGDVFVLRVSDAFFGEQIVKLDPQGQQVWEQTIAHLAPNGGPGIAAAPDGGVVVVGETYGQQVEIGNLQIQGQDTDSLVVKLDAAGLPVWNSWAGFTGLVAASRVAVSPQGDVFVSGSLQSVVQVTKLGPSGQAAWHYSSSGDGALDYPSIATDAAGNVYLGGRYALGADFGVPTPHAGGYMVGFVLKLHGATGYVERLDALVPAQDPYSQIWDNAIAVAPDGAVEVLGHYHGVFDVAGQASLPNSADTRLFGARFAPDGTLAWTMTNGINPQSSVWSAAFGLDGRLWVADLLWGSLTLADGTVLDSSANFEMTLLQMAP